MSTDFVVDNSALIEALSKGNPELRRRVFTGNAMAPDLIDAEALSALRKMWLSGELSEDHALGTLHAVRDAPVARSPHRPLTERAWELRHAIGAYDALYVALAEQLKLPLVTCDGKLANSNGHHARIELYPKSC
jgi:predicted nucleic acid-binding protein